MDALAFNLLKGKTLMTLRLCFVLLCLPSFAALAQGQIQIRRVEEPGVDTFTFRNDRCNDTLNLSWDNQLTTIALYNVQCGQFPLKLWVTDGSCGDEPQSGDVAFDEVPAATVDRSRKGTFSLKISDLPGLKDSVADDGGTILGCADPKPRTVQHMVCGAAQYSVQSGFQCITPTKLKASALKLVFDTEPPDAPTVNEVIGQDTVVRVNFSVGTDTQTVFLEVKGPGEADFNMSIEVKEALATAGTVQVEGLKNGVEYVVRLVGADAAGNRSAPSEEITVIPIESIGLWGYYGKRGGTDTAGCSVGFELAPLLLGLWALRRERRRS